MSISKKDIDKIFVSQWILDHWWITLKVEAVSFLAEFFNTGHASHSLWTGKSGIGSASETFDISFEKSNQWLSGAKSSRPL